MTNPMMTARVTFNCGHLALLPSNEPMLEIGSKTTCRVCRDLSEAYPGYEDFRMIVNVEFLMVEYDKDMERG